MSPCNISWRWYAWAEFDPDTLYAALKLRSDIFVVEQNCAYPDMDGLDPHCRHLIGRADRGNVVAVLRLLPPGLKNAHAALGRVVVAQSARGTGLGRQAMLEGLRACAERHPESAVFLSGQRHLEAFYASLGFETVSPPYLEDGIEHVDMLRAAAG